ncbi:MAG: hypothetical protein B6U94_01165 [Thermofilum sp. ex4484_79]|nr:MAG: hypothetical protein B6U94_01165 [Thermofilum sp. ex4484_79]
MLLGFLTRGDIGDLKTTLKWAEENGFDSISITLPIGQKFLDLDDIISNPGKYKDILSETKTIISAIGFYGNPISLDESKRKQHIKHFEKVFDAAYALELPVVTGWVGKVENGSIKDNIREIKKVWPSLLKKAEDYNIKVAIENCPGNIMYRPDIWKTVFDELGSEYLGLEFDPSHLICQFIDPSAALDEFGDRVYHVHAKDAEIIWSKVSTLGITSSGWCPHRLPGYGDYDWFEFFSILKKHGYDYAISIEHEDPYFKDFKEGILAAKRYLRIFI